MSNLLKVEILLKGGCRIQETSITFTHAGSHYLCQSRIGPIDDAESAGTQHCGEKLNSMAWGCHPVEYGAIIELLVDRYVIGGSRAGKLLVAAF
jgi:hypothetical protein